VINNLFCYALFWK